MYSPLLQLFGFSSSSTGRLLRRGFLRLVLVLPLLALTPTVQAVTPAPDGGYPNNNTAEGDAALEKLTGGIGNTALGFEALFSNTTGDFNTATGTVALLNNTTGDFNTAAGRAALYSNTTGNANTANGFDALISNKGGGGNTANGYQALFSNVSGFQNTANGYQALYNNITGFWNTADGYLSLHNNTSGNFNIAVGVNAGSAITGSSNIDIGNAGLPGESGKIRIGTKGTHNGAFIAGISGVAGTGPHVVVNANGKLGVAASSARFKKAIKPMDNVSQAIHQLAPVTFRYKEEIDPNGIPQFGLIAEEVEKVHPDLVVRGEDGKVMTVRYEAVNAMLLNEFLKEHRKVEEQASKLAEQDQRITQQQKQIEALIAGLQKVSAAVELNKAARTQVADTR